MSVLQVGTLKPSLVATLASSYDALVLPDGRHPRGVPRRARRRRRRGRHVRPHRRPHRADGGAPQAGRGGELRRRLRHHRHRAGPRARDPGLQHPGRADRLRGRHRARPGARRAARAVAPPTGSSAAATGRPPATSRCMRKLSGKRVGILGLGRIGQAIATRFEAFGCPISYHSRREVPGSPYTYAASPAELAASRRHPRGRDRGRSGHRRAGGPRGARGPRPRRLADQHRPRHRRGRARARRPADHRRPRRRRAWTSSPRSRRCPRHCWRSTTWSCCRTWPAAPSRPARRWSS